MQRKILTMAIIITLTVTGCFPSRDSLPVSSDVSKTISSKQEKTENLVVISVNQAGYCTNDYKNAFIISDIKLDDLSFSVIDDKGSCVYNGEIEYKGKIWNKEVYNATFDVIQDGKYRVISNSKSSFNFNIKANVYQDYLIKFASFYRMQRSGTDTKQLMEQGEYAKLLENPLVEKALHEAAHTDDAWDEKKEKHFDLVGGWYDAGDYGIYSANQWTVGHMGLAWLDGNASGKLNFDYDKDAIPDIINELLFAGNYLIKMVDAFNGYGFSKQNYAHTGENAVDAWGKPQFYTDRTIYDSKTANMVFDDRYASDKSVEGSAKTAASLAIVARVLERAIYTGALTTKQLEKFNYDQKNLGVHNGSIDNFGNVVKGEMPPKTINIIEALKTRAMKAYETAKKYDGAKDHPKAKYISEYGLFDCLLWAEAELYLMNGSEELLKIAMDRISKMTQDQLYCTNYWIVAGQALLSLYPEIEKCDSQMAEKIYKMLSAKIEEYKAGKTDNPYGLLSSALHDFGVNEIQVSFIGDMMRFCKTFEHKNPEYVKDVRVEIKKGLGYIMGNNPWNISFSSGIGENSVKFLHTSLDEYAFSKSRVNQHGISIPSALVGGPVKNAPFNKNSPSPWYVDLAMMDDPPTQWQYNEYSISVQSGLFYTVMVLSGE